MSHFFFRFKMRYFQRKRLVDPPPFYQKCTKKNVLTILDNKINLTQTNFFNRGRSVGPPILAAAQGRIF